MEEVKLAIKPYYQKKDITKEEYKDILRKAVHKVGPEETDARGWAGGDGGSVGVSGQADSQWVSPEGEREIGFPPAHPGLFWWRQGTSADGLDLRVGLSPWGLVVTAAAPCPPDLPQQKWGDQPSEGEQPGARLRPTLPLLPQARPQARGPSGASTATQGAGPP